MDTAAQIVTAILALVAGGISVAVLVSEVRARRRVRRAMNLTVDARDLTTVPPKEKP